MYPTPSVYHWWKPSPPSNDEQQLYNLVSEYLRRPELNALPSGQRQLISMVMWKLLASSSFAIAGALGMIITRLEKGLAEEKWDDDKAVSEIQADYETLNETAEKWQEDEPAISQEERESIIAEMVELTGANQNMLKVRLRELVNAGRLQRYGKGRATWYSI